MCSNDNASVAADGKPNLWVELAHDEATVLASQQLRFHIFAEEMGAKVYVGPGGAEQDRYDPYCHHLVVRDAGSGEVVSSTRILTRESAERAGGFYSAGEFDLASILRLPGRIVEIGRTCVHPGYRSGAAIAMLWSGLAQFVEINRVDFLIGCASIPMADGGVATHGILQNLRPNQQSPQHLRVRPQRAIPGLVGIEPGRPAIPPLLKAYLRLGAWVCGDAHWDEAFGVADVFILLDVDRLQARYARHFLNQTRPTGEGYALAS